VYKIVLRDCKSVESSNIEGLEEETLRRICDGYRTFKILRRMGCSSAVLHTATYKDTEFKEITAMVERIPWTG